MWFKKATLLHQILTQSVPCTDVAVIVDTMVKFGVGAQQNIREYNEYIDQLLEGVL
jgi:transcription-repair coupling factor (superfamily II helicase)